MGETAGWAKGGGWWGWVGSRSTRAGVGWEKGLKSGWMGYGKQELPAPIP